MPPIKTFTFAKKNNSNITVTIKGYYRNDNDARKILNNLVEQPELFEII